MKRYPYLTQLGLLVVAVGLQVLGYVLWLAPLVVVGVLLSIAVCARQFVLVRRGYREPAS